MEELFRKIVELTLQEGLWACLFLYLFRRMLSENREREAAYQATIKELTTNINMEIVEMGGKLDRVLTTTAGSAGMTNSTNSAGMAGTTIIDTAGTVVKLTNTISKVGEDISNSRDDISNNGEDNKNNSHPTEDREKGQNNED